LCTDLDKALKLLGAAIASTGLAPSTLSWPACEASFEHQRDHPRITPCIYRNEAADVTDCYERPQTLEYGQREGRNDACSSLPPPKSTSCYSVRSGSLLLPRVVCNIQIQCIPSHLRKPQSHTSYEQPRTSSCTSGSTYYEQMSGCKGGLCKQHMDHESNLPQDCLKMLVLPTMQRVIDKVNFTLSYIGT
jgi:hypothetical protein